MKINILLILLIFSYTASSETVLIHSSNNAKGQGWLFGSRVDVSCWIAVPKHVVETSKNGEVAPFQWRDLSGLEGIGTDLIIPKKGLDLVFARVKGRKKGQCLSRLGSSNISFAIDRQPIVEAISMQKTHVEPRQMQLRDYNAEFVRFVPANAESKKYLKPGLSGAPLILKKDNNQTPMGMIVTVDKSQEFGHAVRFDMIKSLFEGLTTIETKVETQSKSADIKSSTAIVNKSIPFQLINSTGISRDAESTAQAVFNKENCWAVKPANNQRSFTIDILPIDDKQKSHFSKIVFSFDSSCGVFPDSIIIQKQQGSDWLTLSSCQTNQNQVTCNNLNQALSVLRLVIIKRDGSQVGIGEISIF